MIVSKPENRIVKYLLKEATVEDLNELSDWILVKGNEQVFTEFVRTHYEINTAMVKPDVKQIKEILKKRMKRDKYVFPYRKVRSLMKYAAVGLVFLVLGYFFQQNQGNNPGKIEPKEEAITITLDNGTVKTLDPLMFGEVKDAHGNVIGTQYMSKLTYAKSVAPITKDPEVNKIVYNTLKVPYGRRFDVTLSDGTQVFLNSGTSLRYPVQFLEGFDRTVFLTGEAYFNVTKDKKHPFMVYADELNIKVLGTSFNVSHYPEDSNINTVLVEGSVEINTRVKDRKHEEGIVLEPGFKAEWQKAGNDITIQSVDTEIYTAWIQGKLIFRNTSFLKIRHALERKYNVSIQNLNKDLDKQLFDATFDIETIEDVLEAFNKSYAFKYEIENNKVFIR